jgi:hypothetical protein
MVIGRLHLAQSGQSVTVALEISESVYEGKASLSLYNPETKSEHDLKEGRESKRRIRCQRRKRPIVTHIGLLRKKGGGEIHRLPRRLFRANFRRFHACFGFGLRLVCAIVHNGCGRCGRLRVYNGALFRRCITNNVVFRGNCCLSRKDKRSKSCRNEIFLHSDLLPGLKRSKNLGGTAKFHFFPTSCLFFPWSLTLAVLRIDHLQASCS